MFKKIFFAVVLGILGTIFFAQYDAWTHQKIEQLFQKVAEKYLGGHFSCSVQAVSFFSPSLVLQDLEMQSIIPDAWTWRCKKCEVHCSWIQLLLQGVMQQHVVVDGFECRSRVENSRLAVESHVMAMLQKSFLPFAVELKSMVFKNARFDAHDESYNVDVTLSFNSSSLRVGKLMKTTMSVGDGHVAYNKKNYIENIATDFFVLTEFCEKDGAYDMSAQVAGTCVLSHMVDKAVVRHSFSDGGACYITGSWKGDRGRFAVRNAYNSLTIDPIIITEKEVRVNARLPLSYVAHCITGFADYYPIDGAVHCSVKMSKSLSAEALAKEDEEQAVDGQLVIENMMIGDQYICDAGKVGFFCRGNDWKMHFDLTRYNQECKGAGHWNHATRTGEFNLKNSTDLSSKMFSYWRIKSNNFSAHITVNNGAITGACNAVATHTLSNAEHKTTTSFLYEQGLMNTQGCIDENHFSAALSLQPQFALHHCIYKDKDNQSLITLQEINEEKKLVGSIAFPFVRSLINSTMSYDVQGEGALDVVATVAPTEIVADVALNEATIRLPQTYNFIDGFKSHCVYNIADRSIVFENVNLSLYTGNINCLRANFHFDINGGLMFAHAPCILNGCLLNIKKDLFTIVSGNILFSKSMNVDSRVDGHILIEKSQLKENLFSGIIQKQLLSYTHSAFTVPDMPLDYDLIIETKSPIVVDTGFLQTNAHVNLRAYKNKHEPSVAGSIALHAGTLNFPYKPLYISKGVITFYPDQLFDPTIELSARNKIKKYDVSLQVDGSLLNHHIALDATPALSEEQIVGLLLVGAEEHSLNSMMPALIVQNLKNLIFSNNQLSFFDKYFKPLLGSFNINLVPSFTDQTGRGGLRGALEIDVNDRWRAVIQKNFSLTEDTKFELEFLLSDDITLRAIRDERRDLGGEVEMRWKF